MSGRRAECDAAKAWSTACRTIISCHIMMVSQLNPVLSMEMNLSRNKNIAFLQSICFVLVKITKNTVDFYEVASFVRYLRMKE